MPLVWPMPAYEAANTPMTFPEKADPPIQVFTFAVILESEEMSTDRLYPATLAR